MLPKNVKVSFGTASILQFCGNSVWGKVHFKRANEDLPGQAKFESYLSQVQAGIQLPLNPGIWTHAYWELCEK